MAQDRAVLRLHEQLDADVAPHLGDELQGIDDISRLAIHLDDDLEQASVRQLADADRIAIPEADLVQQLVRKARIVLRVRVRLMSV